MSKFLIVDDSHSQLFYLRKMVEQGGHRAVTVDSGEKALEAARQERPEVILMDIVMPGMSGYTATRKLGKTRVHQQHPRHFCHQPRQRSRPQLGPAPGRP